MKTFVFFSLLFTSAFSFAQTSKLDSIWNDPAIEQRIQQGIELNRKGNFSVGFPAYKGKTEIEITQLRHEFLFGANAFMVNGFENEEKNKKYEETFASLFNLACVPFYWKTLEPKQDLLRYASNSEPIYRRPPPDVVLEFCRRYNIVPKGHTLVWNNPAHSVPDWLPKDTAEIEKLITKRITDLGAKYGNAIQTWDIVNESLHYFPQVIMPKDYVFKSFQTAAKAYPPSAKLMINEVTSVWQNNNLEYSPYYMLIQNQLLRGSRIDAIGLQFHFFSEQLHNDVVAGKAMTPVQLFNALDLYGRFNRPLHVSEITIPTLPYNEEGLKAQAKLTRNFYRLWFSHPSVEAIIWWNLVDGTAVKNEDKWNGGLVNNDFSPKPSFTVLNDLINREWKTTIKTVVSGNSNYSFRGFYGEYLIRIKQGKKVIEKQVKFNAKGEHTISVQ
jgi:endo-1,4-beta-xylanase